MSAKQSIKLINKCKKWIISLIFNVGDVDGLMFIYLNYDNNMHKSGAQQICWLDKRTIILLIKFVCGIIYVTAKSDKKNLIHLIIF